MEKKIRVKCDKESDKKIEKRKRMEQKRKGRVP